jgi:ligand-binding sensor domain-containing protein/signal transduction histidine kinase
MRLITSQGRTTTGPAFFQPARWLAAGLAFICFYASVWSSEPPPATEHASSIEENGETDEAHDGSSPAEVVPIKEGYAVLDRPTDGSFMASPLPNGEAVAWLGIRYPTVPSNQPFVAPALVPMPNFLSVLRRDFHALVAVAAVGAVSVALPHSRAASVRDLNSTEQYFFDSYGVESGLPGVSVVSVCQTHDGYLWVATGGGLARFDGVKFVSYRPSNAPAFLTTLVYALFEDRSQNLWIGTSRGLVRYRHGNFERIPGLDHTEVHSLAQDGSGRIWIGTYGKGLFMLENDQLRACTGDALAGTRYIMRLFVDSTDRVWIGTDVHGPAYFEHGEFQRLTAKSGQIDARVDGITEQPKGTMWFGTHGAGLFRLRDGNLRHFGHADGLIADDISDLESRRDGRVWIATAKLQQIEDTENPTITTIPDVPRDGIFSVYEDREGSVWLCAKERGLIRAGRMPYRLFAKRDGLPDENVRSIAQDTAGNLWLAGQGHGLTQIAPDGTISTPFASGDDSGPRPTVILAARNGALWMGMPGTGPLRIWRNGVDEPVPEIHGIYGLFQDHAGAIWVGTMTDGVYRYESGHFTRILTDDGKVLPHARWICEGPDGCIYVATWSAGFVQIKAGHATIFDRHQGLPTDEVRSIYVDHENHIWLGFRGRGLGLWENGRCWNPDGLSQAVADHVSAIVEDVHGRLWLGTPAGVMWTEKVALLAAAHGEGEQAEIRVARVDGSLRSASVWSGDHSVVLTTADGRLLFATRDGMLAVAPDRFPARKEAPPVQVEHVTVEGRALDLANALELEAGAKNIVIDYTAPTFVHPSQVFFRYRLEGYDNEWVEAKTRRTAYYSNLPPGRYTFHVVAGNADGTWSTQGATIALVQSPHFYQTTWFFFAVVGALVAAGYGINRWSHQQLNRRLQRLEEKQAMEKERRRIAKNLHDDLGAHLTEIGLSADAIQKKVTSPELTTDITALSERVRTLAGTLDAIVWSANPANDSLDRLCTFVCGLFQDLCRMASIRCRIDLPAPLPAAPLSPDERSNLFLAAREAMTNMARHSGATEAWLRMKLDGRAFQFSLEDNGNGFDLATAEAGNRNGLANMRSRIADLQGTLQVDTHPGHGTTITMRVPVNVASVAPLAKTIPSVAAVNQPDLPSASASAVPGWRPQDSR